MDTSPRYFTTKNVLTTPMLGDTSITLIQNQKSGFGAIIAESCYQDSWRSNLYFERVAWFRANKFGFRVTGFHQAEACEHLGRYGVKHVSTGLFFPNLSKLPHQTIFLSQREYGRLQRLLKMGKGTQAFHKVQQYFGNLPGFQAAGNTLTTPPDYSEIEPAPELLVGMS
jgi:hypothetical protein